MHVMRRLINLFEAGDHWDIIEDYLDRDERTQFLAACEFWTTEVQANDYETGYKPEAEALLLAYPQIASQYSRVHVGTLYRGTSGMTRRQAATLVRYQQTKTFDLSESKLSSWTINPEVAEDFASKTGGVVLRYPSDRLETFLNLQDLWAGMSSEEKQEFAGIRLGAGEGEVLVINPPSLVVTAQNLHRFQPNKALRDPTMWN